MATLWNGAGHYIFAVWFSIYLFSSPNLAENTGRKNSQKNRLLGTIRQFCRAISSQLRHISTIGKKLVKQQYLLHMSPQYGELWPTSG